MKVKLKIHPFLPAILAVLAFGCQPARPGFNGTYVNHTDGTYSVADDTLIIGPDARIERRTGFYSQCRHHYETEHWRADLNSDTHCLVERRSGKIISLTDEGILVGRRAYRRIH